MQKLLLGTLPTIRPGSVHPLSSSLAHTPSHDTESAVTGRCMLTRNNRCHDGYRAANTLCGIAPAQDYHGGHA